MKASELKAIADAAILAKEESKIESVYNTIMDEMEERAKQGLYEYTHFFDCDFDTAYLLVLTKALEREGYRIIVKDCIDDSIAMKVFWNE